MFDAYGQTYTVELSDGSIIDLIPKGSTIKVNFEDRHEYIKMFVKARKNEVDTQVSAVRRGLCKIIPDSLIRRIILFY